MNNREKLKEKIRKKKEHRVNGIEDEIHETLNPANLGIMDMMKRASEIMKTNPQMVKQISKCVSNIMKNKELMDTISNQLKDEVKDEINQDQTFDNNSREETLDASVKESIQ